MRHGAADGSGLIVRGAAAGVQPGPQLRRVLGQRPRQVVRILLHPSGAPSHQAARTASVLHARLTQKAESLLKSVQWRT